MNQQATDYDLTLSETVPIVDARSLHEMYIRDVGAISMVRLRRGRTTEQWSAVRVRLQKMDYPQDESQTFECAPVVDRVDDSTDEIQYCVLMDAAGGKTFGIFPGRLVAMSLCVKGGTMKALGLLGSGMPLRYST